MVLCAGAAAAASSCGHRALVSIDVTGDAEYTDVSLRFVVAGSSEATYPHVTFSTTVAYEAGFYLPSDTGSTVRIMGEAQKNGCVIGRGSIEVMNVEGGEITRTAKLKITAVPNCPPPFDNGGRTDAGRDATGAGGRAGTGGATPGTGGGVTPGTGGRLGTGGAPGTGGAVVTATGGRPGTGGAVAMATGGRPATGGAPGSGGRGTGGFIVIGAGGRGGTGGVIVIGAGGRIGTGGVPGTGGRGTGGGDAGPLQVSYQPSNQVDGTQINADINVSVTSNMGPSISLNELTLKYWFTSEVSANTLVGEIDDAFLGMNGMSLANSVKISFSAVSPARPGADEVVSFTFDSRADLTTMAPLTLIFRVHHQAFAQMFTQGDDYSFGAMQTLAMPWPRITAYVGNRLVWGAEP